MKTLICNETNRKTQINITNTMEQYEIDEIIDAGANRIIKRTYPHDFVTVCMDKMQSEICHALTGLTEHTGKFVSFKIV